MRTATVASEVTPALCSAPRRRFQAVAFAGLTSFLLGLLAVMNNITT